MDLKEFIEDYGKYKLKKEYEASKDFRNDIKEFFEVEPEEMEYEWDSYDEFYEKYFMVWVEDNKYNCYDNDDYYYDSWREN